MFTDDPIRDFLRHDAKQTEKLERLPKCDVCGEPIQDEYFYDIFGEILCEECLNKYHRNKVEDYI